MKKRLSIFLLMMLGIFSYSQVIFQETFDGISGSTTGGAGTYKFPPGWLLRNVDNKTPSSQVGYVNEAWERREDFQTNVIDSVAFSTSWYSPSGQADDWMWTPKITVPDTGADVVLKWNAKAYDPAYPDGYEVRIMLDPTEPTGGPGVMGNQLTSSVQLFSTPAENTAWTARSLSLNDYRNKTFRIAFRNNSTDKFILVIDDVEVSALINIDASITAVKNYEYTHYPLSHSAAGVPLHATIKNEGALTLTDAKIKASLIDDLNNAVASVFSAAITLNPGQTATPSFPAMPVTATGNYHILYEVALSSPDQNPANNTKQSLDFMITESTMARDNGVATGVLGIGADTLGYLGQAFTTKVTSVATGGTVSFGLGDETATYRLALWSVDPVTGKPLSIIAETANQTAGTDPFTTTVSFAGAPVVLPPGTYVLTAVELDKTLAVSMTNDVFTPGTTFVNWATSPLNGWAHNEDFGTNFAKSYALRLQVQEDPTLGTSAADLNKLISIYPNPVTDVLKIASKEKLLNVQVYAADGKLMMVKQNRSHDQLEVSQLPAGMYVLKITTAKGEQQVKFIKK
ncbi:T9SS-dependent choice-of-anchor J family protein [Kaistella faecalis]|uniref:T9SS-dependent choice-of-anchor J family protein n=1 Tax=Kaistella faecalis TaxID=2852098 RepID=UPI001C45F5D9|nr:T9SS type A sorting domain-containing protein [Chryseobacterium faecale]UFK97756.1 T9SS type A sorting domain-containing protein [Chryseobacterium faecale]